jgi:hypothetical protein
MNFESVVDALRYFGAACGGLLLLAVFLEVYYHLRKDME